MELLIDPSGGIAGDMFSASLISAGADPKQMVRVMSEAASKLGSADITIQSTSDHSTRLHIKLNALDPHLNAGRAREILNSLFEDLKIKKNYRTLGEKILNILLNAEIKAHSENIFFHQHAHTHPSGETNLHEAQDIIIDITGAVKGMQELNIKPHITLLAPVSVGNGYIDFSHGRLPVPAPATKIILDKYQIPWKQGLVNTELCTPTGASILAALDAAVSETISLDKINVSASGQSRGTKDLDIPPLKIYLY
jgi:uncharacterized protein (DUF111 family)